MIWLPDPAWLLEAGAALCSTSAEHSTVLASLFLAGLFGGVTHCAGMCGPFVVAQVGQQLQHTPFAAATQWTRLRGAAALPYHLGRLTTYAALGALAGGLTDAFVAATSLSWLPPALLLVAAALFLVQAAQALVPAERLGLRSLALTSLASRISAASAPLFADPRGRRGYALGLALGFLPCGLLYSALAAAAGSGSALAGAMGLAAFAAGTFPALFAVGYGSLIVGQRARALTRLAVGPLAAVNGALLLVIAARSFLA
jgi:uncharacterized protein